MERQKPDTSSNEIELYIRTYSSLLRSSGEVRVRSLEEAHTYSDASLHTGSRALEPDVAAFGYAAGRLPLCMPQVERIVLGQSDAIFEAFGYHVGRWRPMGTRGRRRLLGFDGEGTLAAYIASMSDIDDLVPMITAYQIEWNKMHRLLADTALGHALCRGDAVDETALGNALGLPKTELERLREALGHDPDALRELAEHPLDLRVRLLAGSFSEFQHAAQIWWEGVEEVYLACGGERRPVYFVSSNSHSLANLLGGYALAHQESLVETARRENPDEVRDPLERALREGSPEAANLLYFALRTHIHGDRASLERVQDWDREGGITFCPNRAHVDVESQVIELRGLLPERFDPRVRMPGLERLRESDACILNIDYPLGLAAYHLLARVGYGADSLLGVYVMGKAATLNAQVGDVMISRVVHDEHSDNTYLLRNAFAAQDVSPYLLHGTVLDNQKAVTVRGAFLQNQNYIGVFYREGYTVLEMEAGPYMSALYECADPRRHPNDEVVNLADRAHFDVGLLHYASDTPNSRRQWLLSKSLGYFGTDSTYACAIAITRRILERELARLG